MLQSDKRNEFFYLNLLNSNQNVCLTQFGRTIISSDYIEHKSRLAKHLFDFILSGRGYVVYKSKRYEVEAGDIIYMRKGINVEYGTDPVHLYQKLWFGIDGNMVESLINCYLPEVEIKIKKNGNPELFDKLKNVVFTEEYNEIGILHKFIDILVELIDNKETENENDKYRALAPRIKSYIDFHVNERLSLENLTEYFHISKRHLIRVFKDYYGNTPGSYHKKQRLVAAAHYLTETAYTVGEIAALLGYCDQSSFSTTFKKHFGIYPLAYKSGAVQAREDTFYNSTTSPNSKV